MSNAILIFSFGGPEKPDDVMPFLENVVAGRGVPRERLLEVAEHYYHFGGRSPINDHNRKMVADLEKLLAEQGPALPVYWGNRNWHPYLADALEQMARDGVTRALVFTTSAFGSYSGCRRYIEDLEQAAAKVSEKPGVKPPELIKLRLYWNHPGFIEPMIDRVREAFAQIPAERRAQAAPQVAMAFTAHSVPLSMADSSPYVSQLNEASKIVCDALGIGAWKLVYQSRSGPPTQPWLEPDILDHLRGLKAAGVRDVVVAPIGFVSDHMEVLYDLDTEAKQLCAELGLSMVRAGTATISLRLPRPDEVPVGYAYVPPGSFLTGTDQDETTRRDFLIAAPLHQVRTGAYAIARHEITYADWIAYLRALPAAERELRMPRASQMLNGVTLELVSGRFRLTLEAARRRYVAWEGSPIRYPGRGRRSVQDWLRFSVTGVSYHDAEAYAAWLRASGRVRGARLCSDREWERAARGADGRAFPGAETPAPDDQNVDVTYGQRTDAFGPDEVGSHPASRSPFGIDDASGNVWEWTSDGGAPVNRGGCWYFSLRTSQVANREPSQADHRDPLLGVRLCADAH